MSSASLISSAAGRSGMVSDDTEANSLMQHHPQRLPDEREAKVDLELPIVRTSSIYSLTLDEIQNTVCEPGKTFGSMNMDEFLTNIWNAEEGQVGTTAASSNVATTVPSSGSTAAPEPLRQQASLSLPAPLSRKTVDEVWAEIHHGGGTSTTISAVPPQPQHDSNDDSARQPTFGEMTLEDFLIKAGVVREGCANASSAVTPGMPTTPRPIQTLPAAQPYGMPGYQIPTTVAEGGAGFGHVMGVAGYSDGAGYGMGNGYGNRMANGYGGPQMMIVAGSPSSPGSPDGMTDKMAGYGLNDGRVVRGGRKRDADDGAVEKVVERRQRRMIKNRESAARSRARKQAYTVELEAELNQLKEENARLKEEQRRVTAMRKKLLVDAFAERSQMNIGKTVEMLRRCSTAPW